MACIKVAATGVWGKRRRRKGEAVESAPREAAVPRAAGPGESELAKRCRKDTATWDDKRGWGDRRGFYKR